MPVFSSSSHSGHVKVHLVQEKLSHIIVNTLYNFPVTINMYINTNGITIFTCRDSDLLHRSHYIVLKYILNTCHYIGLNIS